MDGDGLSAQVERLEAVETGRRHRWSEDVRVAISRRNRYDTFIQGLFFGSAEPLALPSRSCRDRQSSAKKNDSCIEYLESCERRWAERYVGNRVHWPNLWTSETRWRAEKTSRNSIGVIQSLRGPQAVLELDAWNYPAERSEHQATAHTAAVARKCATIRPSCKNTAASV